MKGDQQENVVKHLNKLKRSNTKVKKLKVKNLKVRYFNNWFYDLLYNNSYSFIKCDFGNLIVNWTILPDEVKSFILDLQIFNYRVNKEIFVTNLNLLKDQLNQKRKELDSFDQAERQKRLEQIDKLEEKINKKIDFILQTNPKFDNNMRTCDNDQKIENVTLENRLLIDEQILKDSIDNGKNELIDSKKNVKEDNFIVEQLKRLNIEIIHIENKFRKHKIKTENGYGNEKSELEKIKLQILSLKVRYDELRKNKKFKNVRNEKFIDKLDIKDLRYSDEYLDKLLADCEKELNYVKNKIYKEKKIIKENNNGNLEKNSIDFYELSSLRKVIQDGITEQSEDMSNIKNNVLNAKKDEKRDKIINGLENYVLKTVKICTVFLPLAIFQNMAVSELAKMIYINNRIRRMRRFINIQNKDMVFIKYENVSRNIIDKNSVLVQTMNVIKDALEQIEMLNVEFEFEFGFEENIYPEIGNIRNQFASIEYQLKNSENEINEELLKGKRMMK